MAPVNVIVDAGPLVGWLNRRDGLNAWSTATIETFDCPLHTTEVVLGEACHLLGGTTTAVHGLLSLVDAGALVLHRVWPAQLARCQALMLRYDFMDASDASLVVLSELHPAAAVLTVDKHFRVYRRFRRAALPVVMPPA